MFRLTIMTVVLAGTLLNAQDQPLRFVDSDVLEMVKIVTKSTESSATISTVPSEQLKPAHDVWQQWEKLKAAKKPPQGPVNADTPVAELKRLAKEGHKDALNILRTRLRQMIVDKNTLPTMLDALAKIGHTDAQRILEEQEVKKNKQKEEEKRIRLAEEEKKRKQKEEEQVRIAAEKRKQEEEAQAKIAAENKKKQKEQDRLAKEKQAEPQPEDIEGEIDEERERLDKEWQEKLVELNARVVKAKSRAVVSLRDELTAKGFNVWPTELPGYICYGTE